MTEDGDVRLRGPMSAAELAKDLADRDVEFATEAPDDPMYFGSKVLVIKGEIVVPEPVQVATSYKIP